MVAGATDRLRGWLVAVAAVAFLFAALRPPPLPIARVVCAAFATAGARTDALGAAPKLRRDPAPLSPDAASGDPASVHARFVATEGSLARISVARPVRGAEPNRPPRAPSTLNAALGPALHAPAVALGNLARGRARAWRPPAPTPYELQVILN